MFAYNNRAAARFKAKDYAGAISDSNEAIKLDSKYGFAYLTRANAKEMNKDFEGACQDWKTASQYGVKSAQSFLRADCWERYNIKVD